MAKSKRPIDKVRASRDGHEYHEVWAARHAMQLLLPNAELSGIAVEGLEPGDQSSATTETAEIADLTFYHGQRATFKGADKVRITQFKYSIGKKLAAFRAADAKKTIEKFGKSYRGLKRTHGAALVQDKIFFEIHTNRPIYGPLEKAIEAIAAKKPVIGEIKKQADQFKSACGLSGKGLADFAAKCQIQSLNDTLRKTKSELTRTVVDWSCDGSDALARARLGDLRQVVRDKAGFAGDRRNVIRQTDILATFGLSEVSELLPCPVALVDVGEVLKREQLREAIRIIPALNKPMLIHASGGVGKTVFMDSLCSALSNNHEVVFFDCFGGGDYRAPGDARHHPKRGLVHIANTLACRGLCDPIIPGVTDVDSLLNTFRRRLEQCVQAISADTPGRNLILFIDAIDNAAEHARDRHESSFAVLLAEFLQTKPVLGVKLVMSSRSHRIPIGHISYEDFELRSFSNLETEAFLRARLPDISTVEVRVAQARSNGNARVLEYLLDAGRGLLDKSEINKEIELDDLIQARIDRALLDAVRQGYKKQQIDAFLAGIAILPPPVPLEEYAEAHAMDLSAIESFASDLVPLLERTRYGLTFRDEPTESLVRDRYASLKKPLRHVAKNLVEMQDRSVYAARALPDLLLKLGDTRQLFKLAFDERFPSSMTSSVGKRNIRYSRLKAAVRHAAQQQNYDQLVQLTVELSTITSVDQRGADYIMDYPDLAIAAQDTDATRRLFEIRTAWQGSRHARLAIANQLSGDADEALRHAAATEKWIQHYWQQNKESRHYSEGPEDIDYAAIPFCLVAQKNFDQAMRALSRWKEFYSFEVCEHVFNLAQHPGRGVSKADIEKFINYFTDEIGCITAVISFFPLKKKQREELIVKLANALGKIDSLETRDNLNQSNTCQIEDGMRKAATIAMSYGDSRRSLKISNCIPSDRPGMWSFKDHFSDRYVLPFVFQVALNAAVNGVDVREKDLIPKEVAHISSRIPNKLTGDDFRKEFEKRLERRVGAKKKGRSAQEVGALSHEQKREAEQFLSLRLGPLLRLTNALSKVLCAADGKADSAFIDLIEVWAEVRSDRDDYHGRRYNLFFQLLGYQVSRFILWSRDDLKAKSINSFLKNIHNQEAFGASKLIDIVGILANRSRFQSRAGEEAQRCLPLIESENEVTSRASLYACLARAILPASADEAAEYFQVGLEQLDAIGSGDYLFTNELLLFSASFRKTELKDSDFHTLTNICELNLTEEPDKFPWFAFGQGMSRASGCKALAKLSRWDDRSKVHLNCTLLPYLTALLRDAKIEPEDALALNWLAAPVEFWNCNTETFAHAIDSRDTPHKKIIITELVEQYEANNPGSGSASTLQTLASIAKRTLGARSKITSRLLASHPNSMRVRDIRNEHMNYRGRDDGRLGGGVKAKERQSRNKLNRVLSQTNPVNEDSLSKALEVLDSLDNAYFVRDDFFRKLRGKVSYGQRAKYIRNIAGLENVSLYLKLDELQKCQAEWSGSSIALKTAYREIAMPLTRIHADELVDHDQLSGGTLRELSSISGSSISNLALELIKIFAEPESSLSATVWLALACFMCEEATDGKGQKAIQRLLRSDAARLSESVQDGPWKASLYPKANQVDIFSGLVWRQLGSPESADRWRAAHSIRSFVRLGRWKIIDTIVAKLDKAEAGPFQAPELPFYFMHAQLWLLIALSRIAPDQPKEISKYKSVLLRIANNISTPHFLMRHFAACALVSCIDAGEISVSKKKEEDLRSIDFSPFPQLRKKLKTSNDDFYRDRPASAPKPKFEFRLEYDFSKEDVQYLSNVFGQPHWLVNDMMANIVNSIDPNVEAMYETGGRKASRQSGAGLDISYHTYGEQLGWHAMMIAAGHLLETKPVTLDWWYDDPWREWSIRYMLTRKDGLWLSDGLDLAPLEVNNILMEKGEQDLLLTGDKNKILDLVGLRNGVDKKIIVSGRWLSSDHIRVRISSVLVDPKKANKVIQELISEDPIRVWLPSYDRGEDGSEYLHAPKENCVPWIVCPSGEACLDGDDPYASNSAITKPYFSESIASLIGLEPCDPFPRVWAAKGRKEAHSEAWTCPSDDYGSSSNGQRLICNKTLLKDVLVRNNADLLLLIDLQKYDKGFRHEPGKYTNTIAVVRIKKTLQASYHKGAINHLWQPAW